MRGRGPPRAAGSNARGGRSSPRGIQRAGKGRGAGSRSNGSWRFDSGATGVSKDRFWQIANGFVRASARGSSAPPRERMRAAARRYGRRRVARGHRPPAPLRWGERRPRRCPNPPGAESTEPPTGTSPLVAALGRPGNPGDDLAQADAADGLPIGIDDVGLIELRGRDDRQGLFQDEVMREARPRRPIRRAS